MAGVSAARNAAFNILLALERRRMHSDDLLRSKTVSALASPDRNLATALVLGVLRWQIHLDREVRRFLSRPTAKLDTEVLIALRLGAFQLLHLDRVPARAAIDESVELTKQAGHRFASGMVNAVLRKLATVKEGPSAPAATGEDSLAAISAHPAWIVERWTKFFGADATGAICVYDQNQPRLAVGLATPDTETEITQAGIVFDPGAFLTAARVVVSGDITATVAFREGRVRVQDEGSQLVAELTGRGSAILDCCAAPGGKTLILAEQNPDARIVACEASTSRLEQLRKRLAGLGDRVECRLADATALELEAEFDVVLADVPCSGTGTLGRNPEIRHRLSPQDLPRQAERQSAILRSALRAVRPGGRVIYSTCSLEPEENEQVLAAVLAQVRNVCVLPLQLRIDEMRAAEVLTDKGAERLQNSITPEGFLRLVPGGFDTDGFFIAAIERAG